MSSVPTNWDLAGEGIQAEIDALAPYASAASTTLAALDAATMSGKAMRVTLAGISGSDTVHLKLNGTTIQTYGLPASGTTFIRTIILIFSATNQDLWSDGTPSLLSSFNPSTLTFSTDSSHTITDFRVSAA